MLSFFIIRSSWSKWSRPSWWERSLWGDGRPRGLAGWSRQACREDDRDKVLYWQMPVIYIYAISSTAGKDARMFEFYRKPARTDRNYIGYVVFQSNIGLCLCLCLCLSIKQTKDQLLCSPALDWPQDSSMVLLSSDYINVSHSHLLFGILRLWSKWKYNKT